MVLLSQTTENVSRRKDDTIKTLRFIISFINICCDRSNTEAIDDLIDIRELVRDILHEKIKNDRYNV